MNPLDRVTDQQKDRCPICGLRGWHWLGCPHDKDDE